jgi:hypothetical protein
LNPNGYTTVITDEKESDASSTAGNRLIIEPIRSARQRRIADAAGRAMDANEKTFRRLAR